MTAIFALGFMTMSRMYYRQPGMQMGMGLVAGTLRLCNPFGGCFICSAFAIMAEALIFELFWITFLSEAKELNTLTLQASMGIVTSYFVYVGGYIITQILTPIVSSTGLYIENLLVFLPQIFASGLLAALVGGATVPVVFSLESLHISVKERLYYPATIGISLVCWFLVLTNTFLLWT
jgi:hypothetical protein